MRLPPSLISKAIALDVLVKVTPPCSVMLLPAGIVTVAVSCMSFAKTISVSPEELLIACCNSATLVTVTVAASDLLPKKVNVDKTSTRLSIIETHDFLLLISYPRFSK